VGRWLAGLLLVTQTSSKMEKNFALEGADKYGAATIGWTQFMRHVQSKAAQDPKMKHLYYDAYFYGTRTLFYYGMYDPAVTMREVVLDVAGKRIVDLELSKSREGWKVAGQRFEELMKQEPRLREAYDRMKKKRLDESE
jgi:hypothetical protein